jgi:hypothetical protein
MALQPTEIGKLLKFEITTSKVDVDNFVPGGLFLHVTGVGRQSSVLVALLVSTAPKCTYIRIHVADGIGDAKVFGLSAANAMSTFSLGYEAIISPHETETDIR